MLFSSISFLYYFLPAVIACYFLPPAFFKNTVLLVFSLIFYAWGEPRYVFLMAATIMVSYVAGLLIEKNKDKKSGKLILTVSVLLCLAGLLYFKYADFFISNINRAAHLDISLLKLTLPIGISFYTFQIISYLVDVYRNKVKAQKNIIDLAAYVTLFSQLVAGPIVRYKDIDSQLKNRQHSFLLVSEGITRFLIGLSKKILIANILGELIEIFKGVDEKTVGFYWLYVIAATLHIYFDFSGYSDMAIGLGKIFGFSFPENFDYPYISVSITEFWRRWHMTLGGWFRDYVYIPLGGNRVGYVKWFRNLLVVWLLTGFWHGADWNFILWGLYFAILLLVEKAGLLHLLTKHKVIAHIYVLFFVTMSFVIFNAGGINEIARDFISLFGFADIPVWSKQTGYYLRSYAVILSVATIGATPLPKMLVGRLLAGKKKEGMSWGVFEAALGIFTMLICTAFLVDGSFNPFLYFRF